MNVQIKIFYSLNTLWLKIEIFSNYSYKQKIKKKPESSQRELAEALGFSLGKLNYCLRFLRKKGLVKLQNFQKQSNKIKWKPITR